MNAGPFISKVRDDESVLGIRAERAEPFTFPRVSLPWMMDTSS